MSTAVASPPPVSVADVIRSLAVRFVGHGAQVLTTAVAILCGVPALMYGLIWVVDPVTTRGVGEDTAALQTIFRIGEWVVLPAYLMFEVVQIRPLYVLPITNRQILNVQLLLGMVAIAALHLLTAASYRIAFGVALPVWEPLLWLCPAVVAAAGLSALLIDFRWWRVIVVVVIATGIIHLIGLRNYAVLGISVASPPAPWLTPTGLELLSIAVLGGLGYWLAWRGVQKDRCGELRAWPDLDVLLQQFAARLSRLWKSPVAARPYRSGASAQFWFEFWQKGLVVPILAMLLGGASLIGALHNPGNWLGSFLSGLPALLGFAMFLAGVVTGIVSFGRSDMVISEYRATRPLSDAQLAYAVLKAALAGVVLTSVIAGIYFLSVYLWFPRYIDLPNLMEQTQVIRNALIAMIVGWCLLGGVATVMLTGRVWVILLPWGLVFIAFAGHALLLRILGPDGINRLLQVFGWAVFFSVIGGSIAAYAFAYWRRSISTATVAVGVALWVVATGLIYAQDGGRTTDPASLWALAGWMTLVAAPLATAPLALSWNRHR